MRRAVLASALLLTAALGAHAGESPQQFFNAQANAKSPAFFSSIVSSRGLSQIAGAQASPQKQPFGYGARVEEVITNTPAARAGVQPGDVIVGIDGRAIGGFPDLDSLVTASGGRPLTIDIDRSGTHVRLKASPSLALILSPYYSVQQRWVLGVSHTEFRFISCAQDPDCE